MQVLQQKYAKKQDIHNKYLFFKNDKVTFFVR